MMVVSYRNSTSNHNFPTADSTAVALYLIEILHQTTTLGPLPLIPLCCILSKFYIKPQLLWRITRLVSVVSYRNSTSNHNFSSCYLFCGFVVSYRNSTSNHNSVLHSFSSLSLYLIEILHQTTTFLPLRQISHWLYLIEILHQTTT